VLHTADSCAELLGTAVFYRPVCTASNTLDYTGRPTFLPQSILIHCIVKRFTNSNVWIKRLYGPQFGQYQRNGQKPEFRNGPKVFLRSPFMVTYFT